MFRDETKMGGSGRDFPKTTIGLLEQLRSPAGLEDLCRRYWKPVYGFVRLAWAKSNEDAKDLTQAFFLWLLEGTPLARYDPDQGGFRKFLKLLLRGFVVDREKAVGRLKRGGHVRILPLEDPSLVPPDAPQGDPEKAFDRAWSIEMMRQAIERVRARFAAQGLGTCFAAFERYDLLDRAERPTYAHLAQELGLKPTDVHNHLNSARAAVRNEIRMELASITSTQGELEEEWDTLFGA